MKTVKVRIAVAVSDAGKWSAVGDGNASRADNRDSVNTALDILDEQVTQVVWVEADVPLPARQVVAGAVAGIEKIS